MATGTSPLFTTISGKVAGIDYRTRRNNKIEIGKTRDPHNKTPSSEQQDIQQKYGHAAEIWRTSTNENKEAWNANGNITNISGFNYLIYIAIAPGRYNEAQYGISNYGD